MGKETECYKFLSKHKVVGIDTTVFIYYFENNLSYLPFVKTLFEFIEEGGIKGKTSIITYLEILVRPKKEKRDDLVEQYEILLTNYPNLEIIPLNKEIADIASSLRARYDLRTPDAIQVATSIVSGASALITNNLNMKKIRETEIIIMSEFLTGE